MSETYNDPNKFASPARLQLLDNSAVCYGYQNFALTRESLVVLPGDKQLKRKAELLGRSLSPGFIKDREVLDLGANGGYFAYQALLNGASRATVSEMDDKYLQMLQLVKNHLGFPGLEIEKGNVSEHRKPADLVLALALVHWVYSCTSVFGNLGAIIRWLADLSKYILIVEWIDPADEAIAFFKHLDWNPEKVSGPYTKEVFLSELSKNFRKVDGLGKVTPTRELYMAWKTGEMDLTGSMVPVFPMEGAIQCRELTQHDGMAYWSSVFDRKDKICKQTTRNLALREAHFLSLLEGPHYPRVLDVSEGETYSTICMEKIEGRRLAECSGEILADCSSFLDFISHCLAILEDLGEKGITHRDILFENIIIREGKPVLIDFGWAVSRDKPYPAPTWLAFGFRPPDQSFCDIYSMGILLERLRGNRYSELTPVTSLMWETDSDLRVFDLDLLRICFAAAGSGCIKEEGEMTENIKEIQENSEKYPHEFKQMIGDLVQHVHKRTQVIRVLKQQAGSREKAVKSLEQKVQFLTLKLAEAEAKVQQASGKPDPTPS